MAVASGTFSIQVKESSSMSNSQESLGQILALYSLSFWRLVKGQESTAWSIRSRLAVSASFIAVTSFATWILMPRNMMDPPPMKGIWAHLLAPGQD